GHPGAGARGGNRAGHPAAYLDRGADRHGRPGHGIHAGHGRRAACSRCPYQPSAGHPAGGRSAGSGAMKSILPYPLATLGLLVLWLLLQQSFSLGHILLGSVIAVFAGKAVAALQPEYPRIRNIGKIAKLIWVVSVDV